jgi:hypothetical protein
VSHNIFYSNNIANNPSKNRLRIIINLANINIRKRRLSVGYALLQSALALDSKNISSEYSKLYNLDEISGNQIVPCQFEQADQNRHPRLVWVNPIVAVKT